MNIDISIKIGGEAGQGIQTVGDLLASVCWETGYPIIAVNDFESRIRGGHSFVLLRIGDGPVLAPSNEVHILAALNQATFEKHRHELSEGGLVLTDGKTAVGDNVLTIPFTELAKEAGGKIMTNVVVAGAILGLLGSPPEILEGLLKKRFGKKSQEILDGNLKAAQAGFQAVAKTAFSKRFEWEKREPTGLLISGNRAVALGAVAADCRFGAFYPMSPGTGIMTDLISLTGNFPLVVEQVEDEIAAVNMILGAAYAGVRSITATSGGGFSLMVEGLGLAGITETPIVIVNAQRPGPATGLPTRTAQADLLFTIWASQDEFPRFVFAPGDPAEAFDAMVRAFQLSDRFQVPAVVLTDQYLNDSSFTLQRALQPPDKIERHLATDADIGDPAAYQRYAFTESGISPRVLPCQGEALLMVAGNEHTPDGHISEDATNRRRMVDKRNAKVPAMTAEMRAPEVFHEKADILLVGWGSSRGAIREAVERLRKEGASVGCVHFCDLWPFPQAAVERLLGSGRRFIMVEGNSTAQLGLLIRQQTGRQPSATVLKYDGRPFLPAEIVDEVRPLLR